jgi:hypothetical protein
MGVLFLYLAKKMQTWSFVDGSTAPPSQKKRGRPHKSDTVQKRQKQQSDIIAQPFEPTASTIPTQYVFSIHDNDIMELEFKEKAYAYHNFVPVEDQLMHVVDAPSWKRNSTTSNRNIKIIDAFNAIFIPLYEKLLNELNGMREKRIHARNEPKGTKGRTPRENSQYNRSEYLKSFLKPFTMDDLKRFLACFYRICTLNSHEIADYWKTPSSNECGHNNWFSLRMSKRKYEEIFRCIDPDIDSWINIVNLQFQINKKPTRYVCMDETMNPDRGRFNPHFMFIP